MTDDDAEATLLTLGPKLEWRRSDTKYEQYEAYPEEYALQGVGDNHFMASSDGAPNGITDWHFYPTLAAAKIACERHHATREWL